MDDQHITNLCAAEAQVETLRNKLWKAEVEATRLSAALEQMNAISRHQTNHVLSDPEDSFYMVFKGRVPVHPLTCGNNSSHTILFPYWDGNRVILRCPDCDYVQTHLPRVG